MKIKRKRCLTEKCRKLAVVDSKTGLCKDCEEKSNSISENNLLQLKSAEIDRWGRLDVEIRNALQGQRIQQLEGEVDKLEEIARRKLLKEEESKKIAEYERRQKVREAEKQKLREEVDSLRKEYEELTDQLAESYGIDKNRMIIDPTTGTIRELDF